MACAPLQPPRPLWWGRRLRHRLSELAEREAPEEEHLCHPEEHGLLLAGGDAARGGGGEGVDGKGDEEAWGRRWGGGRLDFAVLWGGESEGWALVEQVPVLVRNLFTAGEVRSSPSVIGAWIRVWALQSVGTPGRRRTTRGGARRAAACGPSAGRGARTPRPIPCTDRGVRTPVSAGGGRAHARLVGQPPPDEPRGRVVRLLAGRPLVDRVE